ncbi:hypothetical protein ACFL1X_11930, partial [Candidatus Hydrogenedentota bacterium]
MKTLRSLDLNVVLMVFVCALACSPALGNQVDMKFDCGTADSPLAPGYERLKPTDTYSKAKGFGWESLGARALYHADIPDLHSGQAFQLGENLLAQLNDLNRDSVISTDELAFRADVPNGLYRVKVTIGDMAKVLGSMDVSINGRMIEEHAAAWSPGCYDNAHQRRLTRDPFGWWNPIRTTVRVTEGVVRVSLKGNQTYYDKMIQKQKVEEPAWALEQQRTYNDRFDPYDRIGIDEAPYYYVGWPFVHNSIMAIEIISDIPAPVGQANGRLVLRDDFDCPALTEAVAKFNAKDFDSALEAFRSVTAPEAQAAKACLALWLAGRLETEPDLDLQLVKSAIGVLKKFVDADPNEVQTAEMLIDAERFTLAYKIHIERGDIGVRNHFMENNKAMAWWNMIPPSSPLYYQSQLHFARAAHMLVPYFPTRGTEREIFKMLEKEFPDNRFVKLHLREEWENYG